MQQDHFFKSVIGGILCVNIAYCPSLSSIIQIANDGEWNKTLLQFWCIIKLH